MDAREVASQALKRIADGTLGSVSGELYSKKAVLKDTPTGRTLNGPEGAVEYADIWKRALPDAQIEILEQTVDGDRVETRFVVRGTFTGSMQPPDGMPIQGNGHAIEIEVTQAVKISKKGRIKRAVHGYDMDDLIDQLELDTEEDDMAEETQDKIKEQQAAEAEIEAEAEAAAGADAETQAEVEIDAEIEAEAEEEAAAEAEAEAEEEAAAEVEAEAEAELDAEAEAEAEADEEAAAEAEAAMDPAADMESEDDEEAEDEMEAGMDAKDAQAVADAEAEDADEEAEAAGE